jgi:omega-6 fatty acid desaturase (delta-12 desaturase)
LNEVIGHVVTLPLLVPFSSWRLQLQQQEYEKLFARIAKTQFWFLSSLVQWIKCSFVWGRAFRQNKLAVVSSVSLLYGLSVLTFGTALYFGGMWTVAKYWFFPWCVYHFWMTTFITTSYKQREGKTEKVMVVHIRYPQWVEFLTHKMNYIMSANRRSLRVPSYNIEKSYTEVRAKLDNFMEELSFRSDFWHTMCNSAAWWVTIAKNFNGISAAWILITPVLALYGFMTTEVQTATFRIGVLWYFIAGLGITVG